VKTQLEWFQELAHESWQRGQASAAAGDLREARQWLERARRLAPEDAGVALSLATVLMGLGDFPPAAAFLETLTQRHDVREAWFSLAAARRSLRDPAGAAEALAAALGRHVLPEPDHIAPLADAIVAEAGLPGWCGLLHNGRIMVQCRAGARAQVLADGLVLARDRRVPASAARIEVTAGGPLAGSPILAREARRIEGVVAARGGGIEGWAWHPADPDTDPVLTVRPRKGGAGLVVTATDMDTPARGALGRPRRIWIARERLAGLRGLLIVAGPGGQQLMGSPLDPGAEPASAAAIARGQPATFVSIPADIRGKPATARPAPRRAAAIVMPVYRGLQTTLACLESVFATVPPGTRIIVVDDASPEPDLVRALERLAGAKRIRLLRNVENYGFPASANAGLAAVLRLRGRPDVVLLNSDTLLPDGWLDALRAAVHAAPDIATATPLSNDATILSYPDVTEPNVSPSPAEFARLARLAARANPGVAVEIPTAIGFCMYIRRECLVATGLFREDLFAQGYGEENDFCLRARHLGWRHVGVPGVFVAHLGGQSFGAAGSHLIERNLAVLERLHPGYRRLIADFQAADPLAEARRRLDAARWRAGRSANGAVVMITHDSGGGVERAVQARCAALRERGLRPILLRPVLARDADPDPDAPAYRPGLCTAGEERGGFPNLRFAIPAELPALAHLLRGDKIAAIEVHHLLGHTHALLGLARLLDVPVDQHVHDYAAICPRITFVGRDRRYCGEPDDLATCEACVADLGSITEEKIGVAALRARSAADLKAARRIVVPSADAATRLRRHFAGIDPVAEPLEDDTIDLPPVRRLRKGASRRVAVIGGIGTEKGYEILLGCARDAAARALPLAFTVIGHTIDDDRLLATGRAFVTGPYKEAEAVGLIRSHDPDLAWIPSVWPETWCFTLGHAWRAGLAVAAFDIGAPAERIRRTRRGWLLPLGLPPPAINNALLALRGIAGDE
jgi:GT2 family glycosyltransferase/glycosyltransferase involved in cell wall biosynthesis